MLLLAVTPGSLVVLFIVNGPVCCFKTPVVFLDVVRFPVCCSAVPLDTSDHVANRAPQGAVGLFQPVSALFTVIFTPMWLQIRPGSAWIAVIVLDRSYSYATTAILSDNDDLTFETSQQAREPGANRTRTESGPNANRKRTEHEPKADRTRTGRCIPEQTGRHLRQSRPIQEPGRR